MKINEPIGPASYGPLLLRLPLGAFFITAGWSKLYVLGGFVDQVKAFGILPENIAALYGTLLPYLEVFVGVTLLIGLWTTLSGILAALMLFSFVIAFGFFPGDFQIFNKDLILLGCALSVLYSGAGAYSVDNVKKAA
jgi:uncharacterized membrane protein YphA (DoxX/SURF4 family)